MRELLPTIDLETAAGVAQAVQAAYFIKEAAFERWAYAHPQDQPMLERIFVAGADLHLALRVWEECCKPTPTAR